MNEVYWYLLGGLFAAVVILTELLASPGRHRDPNRLEQEGCCCGQMR